VKGCALPKQVVGTECHSCVTTCKVLKSVEKLTKWKNQRHGYYFKDMQNHTPYPMHSSQNLERFEVYVGCENMFDFRQNNPS